MLQHCNAVINNTAVYIARASQWDENSKKFHSQEWKILSIIRYGYSLMKKVNLFGLRLLHV